MLNTTCSVWQATSTMAGASDSGAPSGATTIQ
jgi:hypothetical protein